LQQNLRQYQAEFLIVPDASEAAYSAAAASLSNVSWSVYFTALRLRFLSRQLSVVFLSPHYLPLKVLLCPVFMRFPYTKGILIHPKNPQDILTTTINPTPAKISQTYSSSIH
jgi:hypothetical protein